MISARRAVASTFGVYAGQVGVEHGYIRMALGVLAAFIALTTIGGGIAIDGESLRPHHLWVNGLAMPSQCAKFRMRPPREGKI